MWGLIKAAFNHGAGLFLKTGVVKWAAMFGAYFVVVGLVEVLLELAVPEGGTGALSAAFNALPEGVWYWLNMTELSYGLPLIIGAYTTRFIIRRLPVVG